MHMFVLSSVGHPDDVSLPWAEGFTICSCAVLSVLVSATLSEEGILYTVNMVFVFRSDFVARDMPGFSDKQCLWLPKVAKAWGSKRCRCHCPILWAFCPSTPTYGFSSTYFVFRKKLRRIQCCKDCSLTNEPRKNPALLSITLVV